MSLSSVRHESIGNRTRAAKAHANSLNPKPCALPLQTRGLLTNHGHLVLETLIQHAIPLIQNQEGAPAADCLLGNFGCSHILFIRPEM